MWESEKVERMQRSWNYSWGCKLRVPSLPGTLYSALGNTVRLFCTFARMQKLGYRAHARHGLGIWFAIRLCVPYVCWGLVTQLHDVGYVGTLRQKLD